jgi:hypothetical protein
MEPENTTTQETTQEPAKTETAQQIATPGVTVDSIIDSIRDFSPDQVNDFCYKLRSTDDGLLAYLMINGIKPRE